MKRNFSSLLIVFGAAIALFFLFADALGLANLVFKPAQIAGMEIGVFFILADLCLTRFRRKRVLL